MAFEPKYEKVVASKLVSGGVNQSEVEVRLPRAEEGDVARVLCVNAHAYVSSSEVVGRDVNYAGYVTMQVLYATETNQVASMQYTAQFSDKYTLDKEYDNIQQAIVNMQVASVANEIIGGEVKLSVVVQSKVDLILTSEQMALVGVDGLGVYTQKSQIRYTQYLDTAHGKNENSFEINLRDGVSKVLSVVTKAQLNKVTPFTNYLKADSVVDMIITYLTDEDTPTVKTYCTQLDATDEIPLEGITPNSAVVSYVNVVADDVRITTTLDGTNTVLTAIVPLEYKGYVFNEKELEVVNDLFSTTNYITSNTQSVEWASNMINLCATKNIDGNVVLGENQPFMDELQGVACDRVYVTDLSVVDEELLVEGVAYACVLYLNKETNGTYSQIVQLPFSVALNGKFEEEQLASVQVSLGCVSARGRRGKEIDVNATLYVYANTNDYASDALITSATLEDEIPLGDCALTIAIARQDDTVWDIAKRNYVNPDMILEQNPDMQLPLSKGTRVVIYRQRLAEF